MREEFMKTVVELAEKDKKVVVLYGDIRQNMDEFERRFPDRIYNVGICEQSMVSISSGMALEGMKPVIYCVTPFIIKRALEQISLDIDLLEVPVILGGWDACYSVLKPTHNGDDAFDITRCLKNTSCYFPQSPEETRNAVLDAYKKEGPAFISLRRKEWKN